MILVHRLRGEPMLLNADLVEAVEATPDTVLTLVDGRKVLVTETPAQVLQLVVEFRAAVLNATEELRNRPRPPLTAVQEIPRP